MFYVTEILNPAISVPEMVAVNAPEPETLPELVAEAPAPLPAVVQHHQETHPALELLLEQTSKQDAKIDELTRIIRLQQQMLAGMEDRIYGKLEATLTVHDKLFQLDERLRGLDSETIGKATGMLSFVLENFSPKRVISPATPRQLS